MIYIFNYQIKNDSNISDSEEQSSLTTISDSESDNSNLDNDNIQVNFYFQKIVILLNIFNIIFLFFKKNIGK